MEPIAITRTIRLDDDPVAAWASLATAAGLAGWLGDEVRVDGGGDLVVGASARVTDEGTIRRLVVTGADEHRSLSFAWWDEAAPEQASTVTVRLEADDDGTVVTVTERLAGGAVAHLADASVVDLVGADADLAWDRRLRALVGDHRCELVGA